MKVNVKNDLVLALKAGDIFHNRKCSDITYQG